MFLSLLTILFCFASAPQVSFDSCKGRSTVFSFVIEPCDLQYYNKRLMCVLDRGTFVVVEVLVLSHFESSNLAVRAKAIFENETLPFVTRGINVCEHVYPGCPIEPQKIYLLHFRLEVLDEYPLGKMNISFSIKDKITKKKLACLRLPVIVKSANLRRDSDKSL